MTSQTCWRFWALRADDIHRGEAVLYAPYRIPLDEMGLHPKLRARFAEQNSPSGFVAWPSRDFTAVCPHEPAHKPPVDDCECGVYALGNVVEILFHARHAILSRQTIARAGELYSGMVEWPSSGGSPASTVIAVFGEVTLKRAVAIQKEYGRSGVLVPELKGAAARIEKLYVVASGADLRKEVLMAQPLLGARYGVPVEIGEPKYTVADWKARSHATCFVYGKVGLYSPFDRPCTECGAPAANGLCKRCAWTSSHAAAHRLHPRTAVGLAGVVPRVHTRRRNRSRITDKWPDVDDGS